MRTSSRPQRGVTLIEALVAVAILGVMASLSFVALERLPRRARVNSSIIQLGSDLAAAKGSAYGRGARVAVLINAGNGDDRIRYWVVQDDFNLLDDAMVAEADWEDPSDLEVPAGAPTGAEFRVLDSRTLDSGVFLHAGGYKTLVSSASTGCTGVGANIAMRSGVTATTNLGSNFFPPPYCKVPDDAGCTFCSSSGNVRGAVFFEPDGRVTLLDNDGTRDGRGGGSIALAMPGEPNTTQRAVAIASSGLLRVFKP